MNRRKLIQALGKLFSALVTVKTKLVQTLLQRTPITYFQYLTLHAQIEPFNDSSEAWRRMKIAVSVTQ